MVEAQSTGTVYYPNGADEPDEVNNVEKIIITDTTQAETYYIRVRVQFLVISLWRPVNPIFLLPLSHISEICSFQIVARAR